MRPTVLAYYFPGWHADPRTDAWFEPHWTEWSLLRDAGPRFDGHRQPRIPALGYQDESDPLVAAGQIDLARAHGIDGLLVDYYWYEDGGYLDGALDRGLLEAANAEELTFGLMWANHELVDIFPTDRPEGPPPPQLKDGAIDLDAFERMTDHIVARYFARPNYLRIEGKPWFSVYEIGNLIQGLGGIEETAAALVRFQEKAVAAGHPGLHLDAVVWGFGVLPTAIQIEDPATLIEQLGFASATSYVWIHHVDVRDFSFPVADVGVLQDQVFDEYERVAKALPVPFYPNVTVGWDPSPRTDQSIAFRRGRYPFTTVWDQSPEEFRTGLKRAQRFLAAHPSEHPVLTINAWNEWTEGSALLPDTTHGLAYLEAVREVFGVREDVRNS